MLIKYSNASARIQSQRIEANNMAYTRYFMAVTPPMRKQIKRKEIQKTDNPEAWLLIESLNIKPHIIETTPQATSFWGVFLDNFRYPLSIMVS
jgi:hypothetical protein